MAFALRRRPGHDTFRRVFSLGRFAELKSVFRQQAATLIQTLAGQYDEVNALVLAFKNERKK